MLVCKLQNNSYLCCSEGEQMTE
uniref:Uncharacterized protein n=1 Tax=Arundo donax TaxID=35708 RepID=A0A0A9HYR8_ARUDO